MKPAPSARFLSFIALWLEISVLLILAACQNRNAVAISPPQRTYNPATATEVFHLRSECAALARKILDENIIGRALTQSQTSHYNPETNRCYVQLTVNTADLNQPPESSYYHTILYDGQTREALASASIQKGKKTGIVFGKIPRSADSLFDEATEFINKIMEDDRRQ